jgi:hypothetical protein
MDFRHYAKRLLGDTVQLALEQRQPQDSIKLQVDNVNSSRKQTDIAIFSLHCSFEALRSAAHIDYELKPVSKRMRFTDTVVKAVKEDFKLADDLCRRIRDVLLVPHKHKDRKGGKKYATDGTQRKCLSVGAHAKTNNCCSS